MRKFAKISAVLAAMVLALAFVGCKSDDDDDDDAKPIQAIVINGDVVTLYDDGTVIIKASDGTTSNGTYTKADGKIVIKDSEGKSIEAKSTSDGKVDTTKPVTLKDKKGKETTTDEVKEKDTETNKGNGSSSTKNILAGKTYYSIDVEKVEYTSAKINKAKIRVSMVAFDSNVQKVKWTELKYDFKDGAVERNEIIDPEEFNYSVSGSTLTVGVDNDSLIATINSDGSINAEGSVMKEFKGNLYAFAEAKADEKMEAVAAIAHIAIVNGTSCTYKQTCNLDKNPFVLEGTVSGDKLAFIYKGKTVTGSLSDEKIVIDTPEGGLTLKRMCFN